jgi:predicted DNA-binding transcriptional regulator YafY
MEILSYGSAVKVIAPESLVRKVMEQYRSAADLYD